MRRVSSTLAAITVAFSIGICAAAADTRGINVRVEDTGGTTVALYAESHALVVGVSEYSGGWPRLSGVGEDVPAVKAALERQGFAVTVVMDPDRDGLDRAFRKFINRHGLKPNNRLLFYFAGHGHSMKLGYGGTMGYLVGRNAPNPRVDKAGFREKALSMQVIETYARNIESKHALFLFDACFAGSVFDATRAIPEVIRAKTGKPVRQFITSGTAEQRVPDRSIFRRQFVAALGGEGDLDGDGYVTGAELGQFLETTVTNYTRRSQTPQYGKLRDPLLDKGDFVFVLPGGEGLSASGSTGGAPSGGMTAEMMFWQSVQGSKNAADFEDYLAQFPNSTFSRLAKRRLDALKERQVAAVVPPRLSFNVTDMDEEMVATKTANVRAEPTTSAGKIGRLSVGTRVGVTGRTKVSGATWYRVAFEDKRTGYVFGTLLTEIAAVVPLPPSPAPSLAQPAVGVFPNQFKPGDTFKDCADCPEMVVIPGGSFRMGDLSGGGDSDETPVHNVTIPRPFAVGKYEVTQAEWQAMMGSDPSSEKGSRNPVEMVSWNDAKRFVRKLSARTGKTYRLLSEAEWEYVARAGTSTKWSCGNDEGCLDRVAWYGYEKSGQKPHPVGSKSPNGFGVHDTHGNVLEWVEDCSRGTYNGAPADGSAWTADGECGLRILRGGSWFNEPRYVRSADRIGIYSTLRANISGFRVARTF